MIHDENEYHFLCHQILAISTTSKHARANRIASQMDYNKINSMIDLLVKAKLLKRQQKEKSIIVHYTYERRFAHYKSKIHQIWNESFHPRSAIETKLVIIQI
jgi:predicted transcriptional regulator